MPKNASEFMANCLSLEDKKEIEGLVNAIVDRHSATDWSSLYHSMLTTFSTKLAQRMTDDALEELTEKENKHDDTD